MSLFGFSTFGFLGGKRTLNAPEHPTECNVCGGHNIEYVSATNMFYNRRNGEGKWAYHCPDCDSWAITYPTNADGWSEHLPAVGVLQNFQTSLLGGMCGSLIDELLRGCSRERYWIVKQKLYADVLGRIGIEYRGEPCPLGYLSQQEMFGALGALASICHKCGVGAALIDKIEARVENFWKYDVFGAPKRT